MATTNCCALLSSCFCKEEDDDNNVASQPLLGSGPSPGMPPKKYGKKSRGPGKTAPGASAIFGQSSAPPRSSVGDLVSAVRALALDSEVPPPFDSLLPLVKAYKSDTSHHMVSKDWSDILDNETDIKKIAEASYAEVYRVNTEAGSSILKVMRMKLPELPNSLKIDTAIDVNSLISEIRIMNALTTVPGFVTFKDAHLVHGKIPECLRKAWIAHRIGLGADAMDSYFREPPSGNKEQAWYLVVELGDAGQVLDEIELTSAEMLYDIYIGVVISLARAENTNKFEHRDLHENNICVKFPLKPKKDRIDESKNLRYGFSGLEVTIIDYGLSRCEIRKGKIAACDLEKDLEIFRSSARGIAGKQYDTYRRMRTYLIEKTRTKRPAKWHKDTFHDTKLKCSWDDYIPYTNVLWLRYLWNMLTAKFQRDLSPFERGRYAQVEIKGKELKRRLDPDTTVERGAFSTAEEVLAWMINEGRVTAEQVSGDASILSQEED